MLNHPEYIRTDVWFALRGWPWPVLPGTPTYLNLASAVGSKPVDIMPTSTKWSLL